VDVVVAWSGGVVGHVAGYGVGLMGAIVLVR
jgi:hypothetical protein